VFAGKLLVTDLKVTLQLPLFEKVTFHYAWSTMAVLVMDEAVRN